MESTQYQNRRRITRSRELRACTECRRRKLKCDRQFPACASCQKRDEAFRCFYSRSTSASQHDHLQTEARVEDPEQLVQELSRPGEISVGDDVQRDRVEPTHNGATHWSAMLEDIEELRTVREQDEAGIDFDSEDDTATGLLFGAMKPWSFQHVLVQLLPIRHKADRLVGAYFRTKTIAAPFIHSAQFFRLYQRFWDNPLVASPLWTSILFSILDLATRIVSPNTREEKRASQFDIAAAHCLAIGEYYRPQRFAVEALLLYTQSRCLANVDLDTDVGVLSGTLVRLATIMGYHRDADGYRRKISPFEGEMRRRTWSSCIQIDMLISFQRGLPSNNQFPTWDTKAPTNLLEADFDEDTVKLPAARPDAEPTELSFFVAKHGMMVVFEKVIRHSLSAIDRPSEELEAIDREIRDTFLALPVAFQARPMTESVVDSPSVKVTRLCAYFIYQKCLIVLHRKYVTRGRQGSFQICYDSASSLVRIFLDMYAEFEPGGQLETERWFMSSVTWHDFLLCCTTLCLTVCYTQHHAADPISTAIVDIAASLDLLQKAKIVFEEQFAKRRDTRKMRQLIEATVSKFNGQNSGIAAPTNATLHNGQNEAPEASWNAIPALQGDNDWLWPENPTYFSNDTEWALFEEFLDLPNQDFMADA